MTIRKTITASAVALLLGVGAASQAAAMNASGFDHVTENTNPTVFATSAPMLDNGYASEPVDHITEATNPAVFGTSDSKYDVTVDISDILPYQRG